jgi:hypothetical protein
MHSWMPTSDAMSVALPEVNSRFNVSPRSRRGPPSTSPNDSTGRRLSFSQRNGESSSRRPSLIPETDDLQMLASEPEIKMASEAEIRALAKVFHARLGTRPLDDKQKAGSFLSWLDLFNHMDADGSGGVDAAEFQWMIRKELGVHASSLPDETLRGLWNALDLDQSGSISFGEFGHFMRYCAKGVQMARAPRLPRRVYVMPRLRRFDRPMLRVLAPHARPPPQRTREIRRAVRS